MNEIQIKLVPDEIFYPTVFVKFVNNTAYNCTIESIFTTETPKKLKEWAAELRTTKRGQLRLKLNEGFSSCCLGILGQKLENIDDYPSEITLSCADFNKLLSLTTRNTTFQDIFSYLNDEIHLTFSEIADVIDELAAAIESNSFVMIIRQEKELE